MPTAAKSGFLQRWRSELWISFGQEIDKRLINKKNFYIALKKQVDRMEICAVDDYQVWIDGKFVAYGPERMAAGYSRKKSYSWTARTFSKSR